MRVADDSGALADDGLAAGQASVQVQGADVALVAGSALEPTSAVLLGR